MTQPLPCLAAQYLPVRSVQSLLSALLSRVSSSHSEQQGTVRSLPVIKELLTLN